LDKARYRVVEYDFDRLVALFFEGGYKSRKADIREKPQVKYIHNYCIALKIKTLIEEKEYVDRYFSEDYSGYYARSFQLYPKNCRRIHFFAKEISASYFEEVFSGQRQINQDTIDSDLGYCGFIVVKPLPHTVIGRTCLKAMGSSSGAAYFPTLKHCTANLFGIRLSVDSLPFQEQDREVAACATSALWSILYATGRSFQHTILSPLQITRAALSTMPILTRSLPNDGLYVDHMVGVVRHLGLEIDLIDVSGDKGIPAQAYIYAYLRAGIPLLLSFKLTPPESPQIEPELHAVVVVGYGASVAEVVPEARTGFRLRATAITQLYIHDDRIGPFAPLTFGADAGTVVTSWEDKDGQKRTADLDQILIPLYQQIRTTFATILHAVIEFDAIIVGLIARGKTIPLDNRLEWDVFLVELDKFREDVLDDSSILGIQKHSVLTESLPRFLWRAIGSVGQHRKMDLLFDATDLRQGKQFILSLYYDEVFDIAIRSAFSSITGGDERPNLSVAPLVQTVIDHYAAAR
jgi:hypothetical protein